jgi:hypothetical protein
MVAWAWILTVSMGLLVGLSACTGDAGADTPEASATVTTTVTTTVTAPPTEPDAALGDDTGTEQATGDEPTAPPVLPQDRVGRQPLGLDDMRSYQGEWVEDVFSLAGRDGVRGIGVTLLDCGDYDPAVLEMRLGGKYTSLDVKITQADNSTNEHTLVVEAVSGGDQLDIVRVKFNETRELPLDITSVNDLELRFWLDESDYCYDVQPEVVAVAESLTVT